MIKTQSWIENEAPRATFIVWQIKVILVSFGFLHQEYHAFNYINVFAGVRTTGVLVIFFAKVFNSILLYNFCSILYFEAVE